MRVSVLAVVLAMLSPWSAVAQEGPQIQTYKAVGGRALKAHVFVPVHDGSPHDDKPRPAVLIVHGGGWTDGRPEWTYAAAEILRRQGLVAISVEYRLARDETTPADAQADVCDAFAWTRRHAVELGVDPERVAGYGVSAGGQLVGAAGLGACGKDLPGPDLMLLWSPAVDLANDGWFQRLLGDTVLAGTLSPLSLAGRGGPPTAIVQGEEDSLTPSRGAQAFCDALRAANGICELYLYPGLGHLLTRNLANQESDFDVDPEADRDGDIRLNAFLAAQGYIQALR